MLTDMAPDLLAFTSFPTEHWSAIRSSKTIPVFTYHDGGSVGGLGGLAGGGVGRLAIGCNVFFKAVWTAFWSPRSMLVTKVLPRVGCTVLSFPTTLPWELTSRYCLPSVPFRYCSYSFSSPVWPIWLDRE